MKRAKPDPNSKKKSRYSREEDKKQRKKSLPHSKESLNVLKEKLPRKSRWEESRNIDATTNKQDCPSLTKTERLDPREDTGLKELIEDREGLVDQLFQTVTGTALDEIIPDYLKKRSVEELKKLCMEELEKMPKEDIFDLFSRNQSSSLEDKETQTDSIIVSNQTDKSEKGRDEDINKTSREMSLKTEDSDFSKSTTSSNKVNRHSEERVQVPSEVLEEVAKDLGISEGDAELIELEMRARAIRSLLKVPSEVLEEVVKDLGISEGDAELIELEMRARAIRSLLKVKSAADDL